MDKQISAGEASCSCSACNHSENKAGKYKTAVFLASGGLFLFAQGFEWLNGFSKVSLILYLLSIILGINNTVKKAIDSIKSKRSDINVLLCLAIIGAMVLGQWGEAATVVFLFALGNTLQAKTMEATRNSVYSLLELAPDEAVVVKSGQEVKVPVSGIEPGCRVIVRPGGKIAVDGIIIKGNSGVNQALITGEELPVDKQPGDQVFAGTINCEGALEIEVVNLPTETILAKVIKLLEAAKAEKAPLQQYVEIFSAYYTPVIIGAAISLAIIPWLFFGRPFSPWFYKALVLLVISCPCALVISTPVAIISAIGNASRQGILIKSAAVLEQLRKTAVLVFDKTGTLTTGRPEVTESIDFTAEDTLAIAASVEQYSEHPVAKSIGRHVKASGKYAGQNFKALPGRGAVAEVSGKLCYVGNQRLFSELNICLADYKEKIAALEYAGKTVVVVSLDKQIIGLIAVKDALRETSIPALLEVSGECNITMLSGDNHNSVRTVAEQLGIKQYFGGLLPGDKVAKIKELRNSGKFTTMVGDGINDAPALAAAHIGVAMGAAGADAALDTADIILMSDDLKQLSYIMHLSKKTMRTIFANIYFSIVVKAIFVALAFLGLANLWIAVFADSGAAIIVTLNSMRLAKQ